MSNGKHDDFWDLEKEIKKKSYADITPRRVAMMPSTKAIEVEVGKSVRNGGQVFTDSPISARADDGVTRFVPPHKMPTNRFVLFEYESSKPFIKAVRLCSDKENDTVFIENNLFLRERSALLDRKVDKEPPYASYFSYSPRYSQLTRPQLNYYLWWRENIRRGNFIATDSSYIILLAYELAATSESEGRQAAIDLLCKVFANCCGNDNSLKMILRDIICDFSLLYDLNLSLDGFSSADRRFFFGSSFNLPEAFIDFSKDNITSICRSASIYDYKRSKVYNESNAEIFKSALGGAMRAIFDDEKAYEFVTSFKNGLYNSVTLEHRPLARMVNIINRNVKLEIEYYQMSSIQDIITNAVRYSENRLREHLGIKSRLNILSVNPLVKDAIDKFFDENYPAIPVIDKRRREAKKLEIQERNEYDKLYDLPRVEFSAERALQIEEESWETTRKLEAAFGGEETPAVKEEIPASAETVNITTEAFTEVVSIGSSSTIGEIYERVPEAKEFLALCLSPSLSAQRKFASDKGKSPDELADLINEAALEIMSDILLEEDGDGYFIIDDYKDLFN